MIANGIVIGLRPEEIRAMIPNDTWVVFQGWHDAHNPKKAGSDAMSADQYKELVRRTDGN